MHTCFVIVVADCRGQLQFGHRISLTHTHTHSTFLTLFQSFDVSEAISCGDPGVPPNAVVSGTHSWTYGSVLQYSCLPGGVLVGNATRHCQEDGTWSGAPPYCKEEQPETPSNVDVRSMDLPTLGYTLIYTCQDGFYLAGGSEHRTCKSDGRWSGKPPLCKGPKTEYTLDRIHLSAMTQNDGQSECRKSHFSAQYKLLSCSETRK
uniref:Sushi domain-containing protein n=1 Tax=Stegastes partitus TaxID=144197 RepID=A0A3B5BH77_9TELE